MITEFINLNIGDTFTAGGDVYVKEGPEDARRQGDGLLVPFQPDDEVED